MDKSALKTALYRILTTAMLFLNVALYTLVATRWTTDYTPIDMVFSRFYF